MVFKRLIVIDGGFYCHSLADEERITYLQARHQVVIVVVGMHKIAISSKKKTVLNDVITQSGTNRDIIGNRLMARMFKGNLSQYQPIVFQKISATCLNTKTETVVSVVIEVQSRERSAHINLLFFKLSTRRQCQKQSGGEQK